MTLHLVEFFIGPHLCALPIESVAEVLRIAAITHFPEAPPFVAGVLNVRGKVLPILDLRHRFHLETGPYDEATRILLVPLRGHDAGVIVDEVTQVSEIPKSKMGIDPSESLGLRLDYASRVVQEEDRLVVVLDLDKILSEEEGRLFDAAVAGHKNEKDDPPGPGR